MIKSLLKFNIKIKGGIYLLRHFIYTIIPVLYISILNLSVIDPLKWIVVIPMMYLMAVNDYNRLFTLFKKPLPVFMAMVIVSIICGLFPVEMLYLSFALILFRILLAFNIGNKKNTNEEINNTSKTFNVKNITDKQLIIITLIASALIMYFFGEKQKTFDEDWQTVITWIVYFLAYNFILTISLIIWIFKKYSIKPWLLIHWIILIISVYGNSISY